MTHRHVKASIRMEVNWFTHLAVTSGALGASYTQCHKIWSCLVLYIISMDIQLAHGIWQLYPRAYNCHKYGGPGGPCPLPILLFPITNFEFQSHYQLPIWIFLIWTLDHVPSSCIVVMVHVIKGRLYSAYTVPPQSQRLSLRPTLDLDSDRFWCRNELDSAVQLPKFRSVNRGTLLCVLYIAQGIT
jgi:hypothetical protein